MENLRRYRIWMRQFWLEERKLDSDLYGVLYRAGYMACWIFDRLRLSRPFQADLDSLTYETWASSLVGGLVLAPEWVMPQFSVEENRLVWQDGVHVTGVKCAGRRGAGVKRIKFAQKLFTELTSDLYEARAFVEAPDVDKEYWRDFFIDRYGMFSYRCGALDQAKVSISKYRGGFKPYSENWPELSDKVDGWLLDPETIPPECSGDCVLALYEYMKCNKNKKKKPYSLITCERYVKRRKEALGLVKKRKKKNSSSVTS